MEYQDNKPTIKGIFVNSHIEAVRAQKGVAGVAELARRFGKSLIIKNSDDISVREEVQIIELALDILSDTPVDPNVRAFEAGRLHFRNFSTTPLAKIVFSLFRSRFKLMMMHAPDIAGHVFRGVRFSSFDLSEKSVKVMMENNDYPLDHFRGLFYEWMVFAGLHGTVEGKKLSGDRYEYVMQWE